MNRRGFILRLCSSAVLVPWKARA
ncbi:MAG: hypothetical protein QOD09_4913, partial [Bradyrhizobium sp.]|nr:hypothetical protein [Bradyrhizobium sp.]